MNTTPNAETTTKLTRARATLIINQPFFGTLALRLGMQMRPAAWFIAHGVPPTMAVDGRSMYYAEGFVNELPIDELRTVIAHEVGHCVFEHMSRRNGRDPRRWNVAGDYVINEMLANVGFPIPKCGIQPNPAFKGMTTDQVYNLLPNEEKSKGPGSNDHCFDGDPDEGGENGENGKNSDVEAQANDWKIATIQAANAAKAQGKLPANLERFIDEMTNPKVDWRAQLWHLATERFNDDYSWVRPNRRLAGQGIFMPGLYSEALGVMCVVIDTSGSIDQSTLNAFASEILAIRAHARPRKLIAMYCDAKVNHVDEFLPEDSPEFKMYGGGGTDFRPPFAWLEERGIEPVSLVYLTDMYGSFPPEPPPYPVIWCATSSVVGPFGQTLRIEV